VLAALSILLLIAPTVVVLITSFTSGFSLKFPPPGWSTRWYQALWTESPEIVAAFVLSLRSRRSRPLCRSCSRSRRRWRSRAGRAWARLVESLFLSPLMLPTLALGLALLMLFNLAGTGLSFWTLVLGHIAITAPYVFRTTTASLVQLDASLLESARSLGASPPTRSARSRCR
jgi:putative spermidine/putrescine transport system permease protein